MQEEQRLTPAEDELADSLSRLKLAPLNLSPCRLYFRAGQQAERKRVGRWQALAALLGLTTVLSLWARPMTQSLPERTSAPIAQGPVDRISPASSGISPALLESAANLKLRNAILENGLSALPLPEMTGQAPPSVNPASNPSFNDSPDAIEELGIFYRG